MMIFLILLLISVIHIVGYIRIKKTAIKIFLVLLVESGCSLH